MLFGLLPRQTRPIVSDLISRTLWGPTSSIVGILLRCERNYLWCPSGETRQTIKSLSFLFVLFFLLDFRWGFLFCWWSCLVIGGVVSQFHLEAKGKLIVHDWLGLVAVVAPNTDGLLRSLDSVQSFFSFPFGSFFFLFVLNWGEQITMLQ